jgi:hypothetical protein
MQKKNASNKRLLLTIGFAVAVGVFIFLIRATITSSFIGGTTAQLLRCKKDPSFNPAGCQRLLDSRKAPRKRPSSFKTGPDKIGGGFNLGG